MLCSTLTITLHTSEMSPLSKVCLWVLCDRALQTDIETNCLEKDLFVTNERPVAATSKFWQQLQYVKHSPQAKFLLTFLYPSSSLLHPPKLYKSAAIQRKQIFTRNPFFSLFFQKCTMMQQKASFGTPQQFLHLVSAFGHTSSAASF